MTIDSQHNTLSLSESLKEKVIVADTSSLLIAGTELLNVLENCELVIPAVVVSELEDKRAHTTIGFLAREWLRLLEEKRVQYGIQLSTGVIIDTKRNILLRVEPNHSVQKRLPLHLQDQSNDSTVLAVAYNLREEVSESQKDKVVILSNDMPMRLHATLDLEMDAFEFNTTQIIGAGPFDGQYHIDLTNDEYVNSVFAQYDGKQFPTDLDNTILSRLPENHSYNALVTITVEGNYLISGVLHGSCLEPLKRKTRAARVVARTKEQDVAVAYLKSAACDVPIVSLGGSAGTGKTLLAVASAIDEWQARNYQKVIVFRSLHEMGQGQEMGFLPGNVDEKMEAWAGAVFDAIDVLANAEQSLVKQFREIVEISPIAYLRGRSLANTFIILEEAQNFSRSEILNILSRVGQDSKVVLTFDAAQVDNRFLQSGKHADIWSVIEDLKTNKLFAHITLVRTERSEVAELASRILES